MKPGSDGRTGLRRVVGRWPLGSPRSGASVETALNLAEAHRRLVRSGERVGLICRPLRKRFGQASPKLA